MNVSRTPDGEFSLEKWSGEKKITAYIAKDDSAWCLLIRGQEMRETTNLYEALEWIHEAEGNKVNDA